MLEIEANENEQKRKYSCVEVDYRDAMNQWWMKTILKQLANNVLDGDMKNVSSRIWWKYYSDEER